ncbi:MAG: hypothetical protein M3O41_12485 [Pseudomonadota bacterium]|nr:hypothetical protein [Pseudomonadota bacterium]
MSRLIFAATMLSLTVIPGYANSPHPQKVVRAMPAVEPGADALGMTSVHPIPVTAVVTEVPIEKAAQKLPGHPLTSVVVTQCNLIVAVYMTMPDGRLLRYDHSASISVDQLLDMAYTASRSERVEVSCNDTGAVGYEQHDPV